MAMNGNKERGWTGGTKRIKKKINVCPQTLFLDLDGKRQ